MPLGIAVTTNPTEVEYVADLLWGLGVVALSEHWQSTGVVILRTSLGEDRAAVTDSLNALPVELDWVFEDIDDSVGTEWREHVQPVAITPDLAIIPAWIDDSTSSARTKVLIDPGPTFGLGDHPTTRACLELMTRLIEPGATVIDVGCGSGVLGITALLLGASRAVGIDITPAVLEVSTDNARRNGVESKWMASTNDLTTVANTYDLVLANILAPTLIDLSDELKRLVAPNGRLVVSGVLDGHFDHVLAALEPLRVVDTLMIEGWAAVVLER